MPRPATLRRTLPVPQLAGPGLNVEDLTFFKRCQGVNTLARLSEVPREFAAAMKNLIIDKGGRVLSRRPVGTLGGTASSPLMHAFEFKTIGGDVVQLRFTTTKLQKFDGTAWVDVGSTTFTGGPVNFFAITTFGDKLIFSNRVDGLFAYDPAAGTVTQITGTGVPKALHLTTFAGRVIATNVIDEFGSKPTRLRWPAKNSHTKWDPTVDLGSGFEDVTASPSPDVDICYATLPITDELALIFRKRSVWLMSVTGIADAPFRFSLLHDQLGTDSPYSLVAVPGGVCGFFENNFYIVNNTQVQPIGDAIVDEIHDKILSPQEIFGTYDSVNLEYRVVVKEDNAIWRYKFQRQAWTRDAYPFTPKTIAGVGHYSLGGLTIDQLTGTIDGLTGTIDELGVTAVVHGGVYITQAGTGGQYVTREDPTRTQDVNASGVATDSDIEIRTGLILPASPLEKIEVIEAQLEYEATVAQTLIFEWSSDGGSTWNSYSTIPIAATSGPDVLSVRRTVAAKKIQLRCRSATLGGIRMLALHVRATRGAMQKP